ncbi:hypothetical protein ACWE42_24880 [Sutcliffiella cohnii]
MEESNELRYMSLSETKKWMRAVIEESKEILRMNDRHLMLMSAYFGSQGSNSSAKSEMESIRELLGIKEYYFIIALNKSREWLEELIVFYPHLKSIKDQLDNKIKFIKEVRNMREHEIEYYKGKGWKQQDFLYKSDNSITDATSTVINDGAYLVGGRISVQEALSLFESFYPLITQKLNDFYMEPPNSI